MSNELEQLRKAAIKSRVIKYCVCLGIPVLCMAMFASGQGEITVGTFFGFIMGVAILYGFASVLWAAIAKNRAYAQYVSLYKKEMIQAALNGSTLYEQMEFDYNCGIKPEIVNQTGLITASRFFSDCYLSGVYNGVSFFQADVRNVRGQRGGYVLEYEGTFLVIPTTLPDVTQTNVYHRAVDCSILVPGSSIRSGNNDFDKAFEVSSNCKDKAKELLSGDFVTKLLAIQAQMDSKIALTIKNGRMYILLPNKKSVLKPKLFGKYDDSMKMEVIRELNRAKLFIDAFSVCAH